MNSFGKKCVELRKKNLSINEIAKLTGKNKSSIYPYIKDIPLSKRRRERAQELNTERIVRYNKARRGVSTKKFRLFKRWDEQTVLLVAHLLFDGQIIHAGCIYHNRSDALIKRVRACMQKIYAYEPTLSIDEKTGVTRIGYYNVALGAYLEQKSRDLVKNVPTFSPKLKRAFLRAFFDDEGCVEFSNTRRRVRGYQNDIKILAVAQSALEDFGIESTLAKSYVHEIVITGKKNLVQFRNEINFSPGVRVNGNRKNSVWKKSIEKRKILDMAIDSYVS